MVFVILLIVLVLVILGAVLIRRKNIQRGFTYVPNPNLNTSSGGQVGIRPGPGAVPEIVLPTPEFQTEEIVHDETVADVSDDLLDPHNPHHAEWVKDHPEMATDAEWVAEHPEDTPS